MERDKDHQIHFSQMELIRIDFRCIISHYTDLTYVNTWNIGTAFHRCERNVFAFYVHFTVSKIFLIDDVSIEESMKPYIASDQWSGEREERERITAHEIYVSLKLYKSTNKMNTTSKTVKCRIVWNRNS